MGTVTGISIETESCLSEFARSAIKRFIAEKKSGTIEIDRVCADAVSLRKASRRCRRR